MEKTILGLDLGISSIGWALINIDDTDFVNNNGEVFIRNGKIIDCGSRIFDPCENPDKSPSAEPRRLARLNRKRLFRRSNRCKNIRELCEKEFKIKTNDKLFVNSLKNMGYKDIWILRKEALERKLNNEELTRILCHIVKHRGWKSNKKSEEEDKTSDSSKMKSAINKLKEKIGEDKTPGYYYGKLKVESSNSDNEKIINEHQNYEHCIGRKENENEIKKIFEKQRKFGLNLSEEFEKNVIDIFDWEKGIQSMKKMVGYCLFKKGELRAPKESYSAELFNVYTKINNLKVLNPKDEKYNEKFDLLVKLFKEKRNVTYKDIRKELNLGNYNDYKFKNLEYNNIYIIKLKKNKKGSFESLTKEQSENIKKCEEEGYTQDIKEYNNIKIISFKRIYSTSRSEYNGSIKIESGYKILEERKKAILITNNNNITWISKKDIKKSGILTDNAKEKLSESKKTYKEYLSGEIIEHKIVDPEEAKIYSIEGCHKLKNVLKDKFQIIEKDPFIIDKIMEALAYEKNDENSRKYMSEHGVPAEIIEDCLKISTKDFIHISCAAIKELLSHLKNGLTYDKACKECKYEFKNDDKKNIQTFLPTIGEYTENEEIAKLTNPVVRRTIAQTRKVINAIIRKYGAFDQINIEFTRDLGKSVDERIKIGKGQKDFKDLKDKLRERASIILGINKNIISDKQILKLRLYEQQDGKSIYSLKSLPDLSTILSDDKSCEIDHVLPYSKSFDDSLNNKILVLPKENQDKGNRIPYEYLRNSLNWEEYKNKIWTMQNLPYKKKKNITTEQPDFSKWKARNLCDTSYVAKYLTKYLTKTLKFKDNDLIKNKIQVRPGQLTSYLRHKWGFGEKIRSNDDTHHTLDAIIIACATQSMCQMISSLHATQRNENVKEQREEIINKIKELNKPEQTSDIKEKIKELEEESKWYNLIESKHILEGHCKLNGIWDGFVNDAVNKINSLKDIDGTIGLSTKNIVSRMPRRKITGEAHNATIEGINKEQHITYGKTRLNKLTLKNIENLQDKDTFSNNLYLILKKRLEEFGGDAEKAFKEPIYMCNKNGEVNEKTPQIKTVKLISKYTSGGVELNGGKGIATNGGMPRVDIFCKDNKYYAVPIYIADFVKDKLPITSKPHNVDFPIENNNSKDKFYNEFFKFSLFPDELIFIEHEDGTKYLGYYTQYNSQSGQIYFETTDRSPSFVVANEGAKLKKININVIKSIKKFSVDPLGYITEIRQEKRQGIIKNNKQNKK